MQAQNVKEAAHELIDRMPDDTSWDEVVYRMAVRRSIEKGLAEAQAGQLIPQEEIEKEFGIGR
jgi:predicted transcriptional regulator